MTQQHSRLAALMFADIVGYSDLSARDEARALKLVRTFQEASRRSIPAFGGRIVKFLGDGVLAEFSSPRWAAGAAESLREEFGRRADERRLGKPALRVGVHVGDVTTLEGDIFGDGVNVASRLHALAEPGEILVSGDVYRQMRGRREIDFEPRGEREFKGIGQIETYALSLTEPIEFEAGGEEDRPRVLPWTTWAAATGLVIVLLAGGWYFLGSGGSADVTDRSIAVLPFESLGEGASTTFTAGIHGDLLTRLSNVSGLDVISRTSVMRYREPEKPLPAIADELSVAWILRGEVQQVGERIQVNARLVNAREDRQVWAESYQRELTAENLFAIQRELTTRIVAALETRLTRTEERALHRTPTGDLEAYRLYVQGRAFLEQRTEDGMRRAVDYFERAIERDSTYALAWAGLADALTLLEDYGYSPAKSNTTPRWAARRALELNPRLAEGHASLGLLDLQNRNGPAAIRQLRRAVELRPSYALAHDWLSWAYQLLGRPQAAVESAQRAVALDPFGPEPSHNLSLSYLEVGQEMKALEEARRLQGAHPDFDTTTFYEGLELLHLGRFVEAKSALEGLTVPWAGSGPRATLALAHLATGDTARARELFGISDAKADPFSAGLFHAATGRMDQAFQAFDRIERWEYWPTLAIRYFFPRALGPLRDDPGYRVLMRDVNRSWGLEPDGGFPAAGDHSTVNTSANPRSVPVSATIEGGV